MSTSALFSPMDLLTRVTQRSTFPTRLDSTCMWIVIQNRGNRNEPGGSDVPTFGLPSAERVPWAKRVKLGVKAARTVKVPNYSKGTDDALQSFAAIEMFKPLTQVTMQTEKLMHRLVSLQCTISSTLTRQKACGCQRCAGRAYRATVDVQKSLRPFLPRRCTLNWHLVRSADKLAQEPFSYDYDGNNKTESLSVFGHSLQYGRAD